MLTTMQLANPVAPRQPAQRHGRARCIEQRCASSKSATADSALPCQQHERRPSKRSLMRIL